MDEGGIQTVVVVDNGSAFCRAGFALDKFPCVDFPTLVGESNVRTYEWPRGIKPHITNGFVIGDEAVSNREFLYPLTQPIKHGIVTNWREMEQIWHHTFYNELKIAPEEHQILLTEPVLNPAACRERITQVMFEVFNVAAMTVRNEAELSLFAAGCTTGTGTVLNSGDTITSIIPVYEGYALPHAVVRICLAGRHLTDYMITMLRESNPHLFHVDGANNWRKQRLATNYINANHIKEKFSYVALDVEEELQYSGNNPNLRQEGYELPDGQMISFGEERFRCPEALFDPTVLYETGTSVIHHPLPKYGQVILPERHKNDTGIHHMMYKSVMKCDVDIRDDLYGYILLSGGSSMFKGLKDRFTKEITALVPTSCEVNVICPSINRSHSAWIGGSMFAQKTMKSINSSNFWITKREYDESGPSLVHRKW